MEILKKQFILFQKYLKKIKPHQKKNHNPDFAMNIQYAIHLHVRSLNSSKSIN